MAKEIQCVHTTGKTLYALILNSVGQFWYVTGSAFEAWNASHYTAYAVALAEQGATSIYLGNMPVAALGTYSLVVCEQAGGSPAQSDPKIAAGSLQWTGTAAAVLGAPWQVGVKYAATLAAADVTGNLPADVQTIKTQTVTCSGGVTVPAATLASTANIASGTITTVSGNVSGSVGSVVGNVGGNVTGSVGSVAAGGIVAASFGADAITASALATDAAAEIVAAVWTAGTRTLTASLDPTAAAVASQVRAELAVELGRLDAAVSTRSTYAGGDTSGTTTLLTRISAARAGYLDNLSGGAVALASGVALTAAGLDAVAVETGLNARQALAVVAAAVAGKASGLDALAPVFRAAGNPGTTRITASTDVYGNRATVTLFPPA